jgi:hypothetical protein
MLLSFKLARKYAFTRDLVYLNALAGSEWPADGVVHGPLAPQKLCEHPTLIAYSQHLDSSGAALNWKV